MHDIEIIKCHSFIGAGSGGGGYQPAPIISARMPDFYYFANRYYAIAKGKPHYMAQHGYWHLIEMAGDGELEMSTSLVPVSHKGRE